MKHIFIITINNMSYKHVCLYKRNINKSTINQHLNFTLKLNIDSRNFNQNLVNFRKLMHVVNK